MNWELAKKLKDAKYPQSLNKEADYYIAPNVILRRKDIFTDTFHDNPKEMSTTNEFVYRPSLEDLIEACGDIELIVKLENKWMVSKNTVVQPNDWKKFGYDTLIEAVSNYWLKLNE